jgi:hypothetical protein
MKGTAGLAYVTPARRLLPVATANRRNAARVCGSAEGMCRKINQFAEGGQPTQIKIERGSEKALS